jgi:putative hydrolase of HD superfamily
VGIEEAEDVAAHSWGVAWLCMVLCPPELNPHRVLQLSIIHDLVEVRVGDITPHDPITSAEKLSIEEKAAKEIFSERPDLLQVWSEYAKAETLESRFVHQADKLDMALQALRYSHQSEADISEFFLSASAKITHPVLRRILDEIGEALSP